MFNSDIESQMYAESSIREKELKNSLTLENRHDLAYLFIHLMDKNKKFISMEEPYRNDRRDRVLNFLNISEKDLIINSNIEEIRVRVSSNYSFFQKINSIFCYCCLSGGSDISLFQKFIYKKDYKNLVKYQK